jgi:hypothetical protein
MRSVSAARTVAMRPLNARRGGRQQSATVADATRQRRDVPGTLVG